MEKIIKGNLVDIHSKSIYPAELTIKEGKIECVRRIAEKQNQYILPGFIDAHIHIESSLLTPLRFSEIAVSYGTVATVSDPHEIANVCGLSGIDFMIRNGMNALVKFFWTAPSCVPATSFETSGATIDEKDLDLLFKKPEIIGLGEMMNYPGVIFNDPVVLRKCLVAQKNKKVIDGHAPGLSGLNLDKYISAGITTDHECSTLEEALEKISKGMKILIREGSSAKNFDALYPLLVSYPDDVMLCSDDLHADDLLNGHINVLVKRALKLGIPLFNVINAVSRNPALHYNLPVGLLRKGDEADFIIVRNLAELDVLETWINGKIVFLQGNEGKTEGKLETINRFSSAQVTKEDLKIEVKGKYARVMKVQEGSIATLSSSIEVGVDFDTFIQENEILKLYVKDRYFSANIGKALVKGFGHMDGAIASTIAHDSHNIIAIGDSLDDIQSAINCVVDCKGGICFVHDKEIKVLELPVAGLMSDKRAQFVSEEYKEIIHLSKLYGCKLNSPLMTLSFLALLVIPSLKLSDRGLFDVNSFNFTELFFD